MILLIGTGLIVATVLFFITVVHTWWILAALFFGIIGALMYLLHDHLNQDYFTKHQALDKYRRVGLSYFVDRDTGLPVNVQQGHKIQTQSETLNLTKLMNATGIRITSVSDEEGQESIPQNLLNHQITKDKKKANKVSEKRYPLQSYRKSPHKEASTLKAIEPNTADEFRKSALQTMMNKTQSKYPSVSSSEKQSQFMSVITVPEKILSHSTLKLLDQLNETLPSPRTKDMIIIDSLDPKNQEKGLVSLLKNSYDKEDVVCEGLLSKFDVIPGVGRNWDDLYIQMNQFLSESSKSYGHIYIICSDSQASRWRGTVQSADQSSHHLQALTADYVL